VADKNLCLAENISVSGLCESASPVACQIIMTDDDPIEPNVCRLSKAALAVKPGPLYSW
jgi:hypothetical protein